MILEFDQMIDHCALKKTHFINYICRVGELDRLTLGQDNQMRFICHLHIIRLNYALGRLLQYYLEHRQDCFALWRK